MKQFLKIILSLLLVQLLWSGACLCAADPGNSSMALTDDLVLYESDDLGPDAEQTPSEVYACPMGQTAAGGLQSLSRRLRTVSSRIQLLSEENLLFLKTLIGHLSRHQSKLTACATRTFTSYRLSSWEVPADCYVFGIRHIII